ncbi:MAG: tetraacyldisaccharide 4'-kinase [bacterium]
MNIERRIWSGHGAAAAAARGVLTPASWLYRAAVAVRNRRFDRDEGATHASAVPALSLGNITVGGTGKTPVAAWAAARLRAQGGSPAIVMRGYGDDEPLVHGRLNPDVPVVVDADRVRGAERARALGSDCVILDDGFQHRRISRVSDWVLVAAEEWRDDLRILPAGPLREPIGSLVRADVLIVTRKSASQDEAESVAARLRSRFPRQGVASCHLAPQSLVNAHSAQHRSLADLQGTRVAAIVAIGAPDAFFAQLRSLGAAVRERAFPDHHAFSSDDVMKLARDIAWADVVVCTLKDAVKLAPVWTAASAPLWYVSQIAVIEQGSALLDQALQSVLAARQPA